MTGVLFDYCGFVHGATTDGTGVLQFYVQDACDITLTHTYMDCRGINNKSCVVFDTYGAVDAAITFSADKCTFIGNKDTHNDIRFYDGLCGSLYETSGTLTGSFTVSNSKCKSAAWTTPSVYNDNGGVSGVTIDTATGNTVTTYGGTPPPVVASLQGAINQVPV